MSKETVVARSYGARQRWWRARQVLEDSLTHFFQEDSLMVSGSIAYHALLAVFPFMLLVLGLGGIYIHRYELTGRLTLVLNRYLPVKIEFLMQNLVGISRAYGRVGLVSALLLFWSSSGVFLPLEKALNRAWEVEKGRSWWRRRLLALEMAFNFGFLFVASSALLALDAYIHGRLYQSVPHPILPFVDFSYHLLFVVATFGMTLAMFLLLFERLPNRPISILQALPSALLTALFWEGARSLFTLLLPLFNYRQVYGSIGVVVALMSWIYISSAVMLFGAQVSRALYRTFNPPSPEPLPVSPTAEPAGKPA